MSNELVTEVYQILGENRPSNRRRLAEIFKEEAGLEIVKEGLQKFLKTWVDADWLDEDSLWNTGKMFKQFSENQSMENIFSDVRNGIANTEKGSNVMRHFMSGFSSPAMK